MSNLNGQMLTFKSLSDLSEKIIQNKPTILVIEDITGKLLVYKTYTMNQNGSFTIYVGDDYAGYVTLSELDSIVIFSKFGFIGG